MAISLSKAAKEAVKDIRRVRENLTLSFENTLLDIGEALAFYTPIDTGLASSNWNVTSEKQGRISTVRDPRDGPKGAASMDAMKQQIQTFEISNSAIFHNPVDYIDDLEKGTSRQAPAGMVTPTLARVDDIWLSNLNKYGLI